MTIDEVDLQPFLEATAVVDYNSPDVAALAGHLAHGASGEHDVIRRCFEWVRDQVGHSADVGASVVTCTASEVLRHCTGLCYAKSHLLAGLLRANGIPTGFCYQRLSIDGGAEGPHSLHGLNAVWLNGGWFRIDARGNRADVDAQFTPPVERLAFKPRPDYNEYDIPGVLAEPMPDVLNALSSCKRFPELWSSLPDIENTVSR